MGIISTIEEKYSIDFSNPQSIIRRTGFMLMGFFYGTLLSTYINSYRVDSILQDTHPIGDHWPKVVLFSCATALAISVMILLVTSGDENLDRMNRFYRQMLIGAATPLIALGILSYFLIDHYFLLLSLISIVSMIGVYLGIRILLFGFSFFWKRLN